MVRDLARKYALLNAVQHDGRANAKAVLGRLLAEDASLRPRAKDLTKLVEDVVAAVNALDRDAQRAEIEGTAPELLKRRREVKARELPDLSNVRGSVVMRFAPFPSGPLHIGHARAIFLNDYYVRRYGGKLILAYDDTIGSEQKPLMPEAYDLIRDGIGWLGVSVHEEIYKSDRMPAFYQTGDLLLARGGAYVCECPPADLRANREKGVACAHRGRAPEENLDLWRRMLKGEFGEGEAIVRIRTDVRHPNPAFRDRVLFRISEREHPRVGRKYRVWPLLEFSWAVDDHLLGVTHVLRGKDLVMEDEMERAIWDRLDVQRRPEFIHYGFLFFKDMDLSKSQLARDIREGRLAGVDDPRTWTLQSLRRRGISPEALRTFILSFGISLTDVEVSADNLYAENRKVIDASANRYFFVPEPVKITIEGLPAIDQVQAPVHPDFPERGTRALAVSPIVYVPHVDYDAFTRQEVRLKDFCNVVLDVRSEFTGRELKDVPKIQWVAEPHGVATRVVMPDGGVSEGLAESNLRSAREGDVVQFERFGFVRVDSIGADGITCCFAHR
ncbi:MAG TPA: glutamate--tRNA ligase [Thermoplasmata archaeon]|nr:glutamate--tRNA ligase [Thermoplasmata archaeon]